MIGNPAAAHHENNAVAVAFSRLDHIKRQSYTEFASVDDIFGSSEGGLSLRSCRQEAERRDQTKQKQQKEAGARFHGGKCSAAQQASDAIRPAKSQTLILLITNFANKRGQELNKFMKSGETPRKKRSAAAPVGLVLAAALLPCSRVWAQAGVVAASEGVRREAAPLVTPVSAPDATTAQGTLTEQIIRGRVQLEAGNQAAMLTLQNAAQQSLGPLVAAAGPEILTKSPGEMPRTATFYVLARQAAEAHYWWGVAADRFAQRDWAMVAFARAARFALGDRSGIFSAAREALPNLRGALSEGLPLVAPDDTLETISSIAHANPVTGERLWRPLRFAFNLSDNAFTPTTSATPNAPGGTRKLEFLITDGYRLFASPSARDVKPEMANVPPPFRGVPDDALPGVLKMSTVVTGFMREQDGPNRGMWRQIVRVHYPHKVKTKNNRDDLPRAEALCLQFLKIHALTRLALGLENPYLTRPLASNPPLTTIWLSEVSALWPRDEDDPAILASLGMIEMPKVNIPSTSKPPTITEIETTPVSRPWLASGQSLDVPGDIIFFKTSEPRSEAEWLRELAHEYGHVVLPIFNGFRPPLEPFGNGLLGESLGIMWAAAAPTEFASPLQEIQAARTAPLLPAASVTLVDTASAATAQPATLPAAETEGRDFARELESHVAANALASLNQWNLQGPGAASRRDPNAAGLQYLQGLTVYIERVYGARTLSAALTALPRMASVPLDPTDETATVNVVSGSGTPGSLAVGAGGLLPGTLPNNVPVSTPAEIPPLQSVALLNSFAASLKNGFAENQNKLPIWLAGSLSAPVTKLSAAQLIARAPSGLKSGERATSWLFVPINAAALRIEWKSASGAQAMTVDGGWKASTLPPTVPGATHALRIETAGHSGWQRFAFTAPADLTWSGAWFEKAANAPAAAASGSAPPRR